MPLIGLLLLVVSLFDESGAAWAQTMKEAVTLLAAPNGVPTSNQLKAGTPIKILQRKQLWLEVAGSEKTGWVQISAIQFSSKGQGPVAIDTGRLGANNIVATSAARGLSAKELLHGQPDAVSVDKLDLLMVDKSAVDWFRKEGQLVVNAHAVQLVPPKPSSKKDPDDSVSAGASKSERKSSPDEY